MLSHAQWHNYVCGDAKMRDDVFEEFMAIAKQQGKLNDIGSIGFVLSTV